MKPFANANVRDLKEAVTLVRQVAQSGRTAAFASGGSDLLPLMKDEIVSPDVIVNLKTIPRLDQVELGADALTIGGLITLEALSGHPIVRSQYAVLAEAAESVATPQIRRVGTLAGNVCQRPWCWYYRNGFPCYKAGGKTCFTPTGENQFNAIFGGGPSFIVHPSDAAPALVALNASFRIAGPAGERALSAAEFFVGPRQNPARENVLADDEILASIHVPAATASTRSTYEKVMDREAWTHALVSVAVVLQMEGETCRGARIVLGGVAPIPWRVPEAERLLDGKRVTESLAKQVGDASIAGARPMSKNRYKVSLTRSLVERTVLELAQRG